MIDYRRDPSEGDSPVIPVGLDLSHLVGAAPDIAGLPTSTVMDAMRQYILRPYPEHAITLNSYTPRQFLRTGRR